MDTPDCIFCDSTNNEIHSLIAENDHAYARWDNFPVSNGHAEVIPKRHVESFFDLTTNELVVIKELLVSVKNMVDEHHKPDEYNIGVNDGEAAGRTVHHCHVHLIPRYKGDVENPRGGVRHVIPEKGTY